MAHEPAVRGGHLVDGLGGEPAPGDIAIDAGTIAPVGHGGDDSGQSPWSILPSQPGDRVAYGGYR